MAENVGEKVTEILQRVRDPQGGIHSRTFVVDILSQCQRLINARAGFVTGSASLGINPRQLFYSPVSTLIPEAASIIDVRFGGSSLDRMAIDELRSLDSSWYRHIDNSPNAYAMIGKEILVIYPGIEVSTTATVDYIKLLDDFAAEDGEDDSFEVADQDVPTVLDLAELIFLVRQRDHGQAISKLSDIETKLSFDSRTHGV